MPQYVVAQSSGVTGVRRYLIVCPGLDRDPVRILGAGGLRSPAGARLGARQDHARDERKCGDASDDDAERALGSIALGQQLARNHDVKVHAAVEPSQRVSEKSSHLLDAFPIARLKPDLIDTLGTRYGSAGEPLSPTGC